EHDNYKIRIMLDNGLDKPSLKSLIDMNIKKPVKDAEYGIALPIEKDGDEENIWFVKSQK
ncbi:MAG: hypothetical protein EXX96DRAFT_471756, partial [Benjaminiella poitrasii]